MKRLVTLEARRRPSRTGDTARGGDTLGRRRAGDVAVKQKWAVVLDLRHAGEIKKSLRTIAAMLEELALQIEEAKHRYQEDA